MPIQIGDILGDYQITGVLGRGGMGRVFRVRSLVTDREEAMKVVLPDLDEDPAFADRFLREIKVHASLQHPNIAALHTALRIEGRLVMILELVEGISLEEMLNRGPVEIDAAVHYVHQVLAALDYAHGRGVIHRDIKPANILIAPGGVVKLTDFGIARPASGARLTGTGVAIGTLAYMSPEQIRSGHVDSRSDLYSLGVLFYEMVAGRRPIEGDTEHSLMEAQLHVVPPDAATVNPLVPQALSATIMRALAKEPETRFQTAGEFQAALQYGGSITAVPPRTAATKPDLVELEARLARSIGPIATRLVADAARRYGSISEIRQALAAEIQNPKEREAFLQTNPTAGAGASAVHPTHAPMQHMTFDSVALDRVAQALAGFIGPIAKVVVHRAARTARSAEELQNLLAQEIPSPAERERFLATVRPLL